MLARTTIWLLFFWAIVISGCFQPRTPITADVSPRANVVKSAGDSFVNFNETEGSNDENLWIKIIILGVSGIGIIGIDCWVCRRFRRSRRAG